MASPKACSSSILKLWFFARSTSEVGGGKFVPKPHASNFLSVFLMLCFLKETNFRQTLPEIACSLLAQEVQQESEQGSSWNQMFAPCREQTGNPSHKLRRYLGSLFKSRLHYASAGEESLVRFATHIPGDDVGWVCWKRLEGYERDVSNRVRLLLPCGEPDRWLLLPAPTRHAFEHRIMDRFAGFCLDWSLLELSWLQKTRAPQRGEVENDQQNQRDHAKMQNTQNQYNYINWLTSQSMC